MRSRQAPFEVRALPDPGLRQLAHYYKLESMFKGRREREYFELVSELVASFRKKEGYDPTPAQLQALTYPWLERSADFVDYLLSRGITDFNNDKEKVARLAEAAAAILVTRYLDGEAPASHS